MNTNQNSSALTPTSNFVLKPMPQLPALPPVQNAVNLLADQNLTPPVEIVAGLIHQGTKAVLGGSSKAGKTWLLLDLALSVATGTKFMRWNTTQGRVLYLNFEIPSQFMRERVQALINHRKLAPPANLEFLHLRGKSADFNTLVRQIIQQAENGDYAMLILDPIYKAMGAKSENMSGGVGALCQQLERLAERTGAAVVYAHHFTKGKQTHKKAIDRLSGSGVFGRDADSIILLSDHQEPHCFTVDLVLRNLPPQTSFVTQWVYPSMVERDDLEPEGQPGQENERCRQLLTLLLPKPLTTGEWEADAKLQGIPHASFFRAKGELLESGYIVLDQTSKTWTVVPGLIVTGDTGDTSDTEEPDETFDTRDTSETPGFNFPIADRRLEGLN